MVEIKDKVWSFYCPLRAYADHAKPLSLAFAASTVTELVQLTRGVFKPTKAEGGLIDDDLEEGETHPLIDLEDEREVVSAIVKITRLTVIRQEPTRKKRKLKSQDQQSKAFCNESRRVTLIPDDNDTISLATKPQQGQTLPDPQELSVAIKEQQILGEKNKCDPQLAPAPPATSATEQVLDSAAEQVLDSAAEQVINSAAEQVLASAEESGEAEMWAKAVGSERPGVLAAGGDGTVEAGEVSETVDRNDDAASEKKELISMGGNSSCEDAPVFVFEIEDEDEESRRGSGKILSEEDEEDVGDLLWHCPSLKAWRRRHKLFSRFDEGIKMDETAWFEVSPEAYARRVAERVGKCLGEDGRPVLAACCGVGGDAIQLALRKEIEKVVCVDVLEKKMALCRHNGSIYGVESKLEFVVEDINKFAERQKLSVQEYAETVELPVKVGTQVVRVMKEVVKRTKIVRPFSWAVMSPPWGGTSYRQLFAYTLSAQIFTDLIRMIQSTAAICDNICLILPRNQDINEIINLAAHGLPDHGRFLYMELEKLSPTAQGYPLYIAVYLSRSPAFFLSDSDPAPTKYDTRKLTTIDEEKRPKLPNPRPPLPCISVMPKYLATFKATTNCTKLDSQQLHHLVFSRFLRSYLQEPAYNIETVEFSLHLLGLSDFLNLVQETVALIRKGGLSKVDDPDQPRSKGGVFFAVFKDMYPSQFKVIRKWRKHIQNEFKKASVPSTA